MVEHVCNLFHINISHLFLSTRIDSSIDSILELSIFAKLDKVL